MCAIFGLVNYKHVISGKHLKELVEALSTESEVRGTDASGIAYVKNGEIVIYKKPKPAHKMKFYFPADTTILTGHTRMTTQGNAKFNFNNHPFAGKTADGCFALCHNGVIYNYDFLEKTEDFPDTHIETDSYVAVQLIEKYGRLDFGTIAKMSETVQGSFVFTILNDDNTLYISKGDNPLCLIHYKQLGLYVYTSTTDIMRAVLKGSFLERFPFEVINVNEGEIISISKNGKLERSCFTFEDYGFNLYYDRYYDYYKDKLDDSYLYSICNMFGISQEDMILLYEMGYCDEEIEMMLDDKELLQSCIEEAKMCIGEYI